MDKSGDGRREAAGRSDSYEGIKRRGIVGLKVGFIGSELLKDR